MLHEEYARSIEAWRARMDAGIRRDNDWLALAGLYWLKNGINTVGSSRDCEICLPKSAPALLGAFELDGAQAILRIDIGQCVDVNGAPVQSTALMRLEDDDQATYVTVGELRMSVFQHAGRVGVRLWDNNRRQRHDFPARTWFAMDGAFHVRGLYTPYPAPVRVKLPASLGGFDEGYVQGYVSFRLGGKSHKVDAAESEDRRLHLHFKDLTNGLQTYPAGRYLQTDTVSEEGEVELDFNRAYNPPSAFTEFAICAFTPTGNDLRIPVAAGERYAPMPTPAQ